MLPTTAGADDAAVHQVTYAEIASAGCNATARDAALAVILKPFRLPESLHDRLGKSAPFIPATIATLPPSTADELLRRSEVWVHLCGDEYADAEAAYANERFSLRFAAARADRITFYRTPGTKSYFVLEQMGEKKSELFMGRTMTVKKLTGEDVEDGPEVLRFTGPESKFKEMEDALEGIPHRLLSHRKDTVRMYEVIVEALKQKQKMAKIGLVEERRAVLSSRFKDCQVTIRPRRNKKTAEEMDMLAKTFTTAVGALLKQGSIRLRFASPDLLQEAVSHVDRDAYFVIFDVGPTKKKEEQAVASWSKNMTLPEPKEIWAIQSLNARMPEVFEEAAALLKLRIYKLPSFTLALVERTMENGALSPIKLSDLDIKFRGMMLDRLDRF